MQVKKLMVDNHKCLVDFSINFETVDGGSSTILIGENGTGKTTMLETLLEIMISFNSPAAEKRINYSYEFEYLFAGEIISIRKAQKQYAVAIGENCRFIGGMSTIRKNMRTESINIFPERIVAFYSGNNNKFSSNINEQNVNYRKTCREVLVQYRNAIAHADVAFEAVFPKRKFTYCEEAQTDIYLCAILGGQDSFEKRHLREVCHFEQIQSVRIQIDGKKLRQYRMRRDDQHEWIDIFYEIVDFIDARFTDLLRQKFSNSASTFDYFELDDISNLNIDSISIFEFFEKLQSLFNAKFDVYVSYGESRVKCSDLSEGQRQLIRILGMLGVCKSEDCLVLMDEPDAHMNPRWKYDLKDTIDESLSGAIDTQALIATHDPLVVNGVDKRFIRIFANNLDIVTSYNQYFTKVIEPTEETEGMGIDGLLQSEYYGLKTSYDKASSDKFIKRQELYSKLISNEINDVEKEELRSLTREVGSLPMSYNSIDFLYDDFVGIYRKTDLYAKEYLTYEDIQARREKIKEIIASLFEGQS